jgi:serine protease Do
VIGFPAVLLAALLLPLPTEPQPPPPEVAPALDEAVRRVYPALVRLHIVAVSYSGGREVKNEVFGSGVIVSPEGHVVTNHHVAGDAVRIRCYLQDREELDATLVGTDPLSDIAVVKMSMGARSKPLPVADWGDSDALRVGDVVYAMGSPLALAQSVTRGIVSNTEMTFAQGPGDDGFELSGEDVGSLVRWIAHDAEIFPGNSGGPLVNAAGEIVGINEVSYGLAGAIPGNLARSVAAELMAGGEVKRSWLGLGLQPRLKSNGSDGVLVASVGDDSPAWAAGLRPGDVLVRYDGHPVQARHVEELAAVNRLLLHTPVGKAVELVFRRAGQERRATATPVARGAARGSQAEAASWGITLQDLPLLQARELDRAPFSGALVTSVRAGSPAAESRPPLQARDTIVAVGERPVSRVTDFMAVADPHGDDPDPRPLLVTFDRGKERMLTVVRPTTATSRDRSAEATKAWLPALVQSLTPDVATALGLPDQTGVRVTHVQPGSSAARAGLQVGDVILKLDGETIAASQPEDAETFAAMLRQYRVGSVVVVEGMRGGKPLRLEVRLDASPRKPREVPEYWDHQFDFGARDLTVQDHMRQPRPTIQGALVTSVESGGWASLARVSPGDVITSVDGAAVADVGALETALRSAAEERRKRVVFLVRRGIHTLFLELEPTWDPA